MVKIPLTNSPNQTLKVTMPVNGETIQFRFKLWFNYQANYWLLSAYDIRKGKEVFTNLPLLTSKGPFADIICQLDYMKIGICVMVPIAGPDGSMADENNLGTSYIMVWGDNNV